MAAYSVGTDGAHDVIDSLGLDDATKGQLNTLIDQVADSDGSVEVSNYDPNTPIPEGTDYLVVTGGTDHIDLSLQDVGNVPIIDASGADVGVTVDLRGEGDGASDQHVVVGSSQDDQVMLSGSNGNFIDGGAGDDTLFLWGNADNWTETTDETTGVVTHQYTGPDGETAVVYTVGIEHVSYDATDSAATAAFEDIPDPDQDPDY